MTFKEQFDFDYPDHKNKDIPLFGCPFDYGYEASRPCKDHTQRNLRHCRECWNREMPGTKEKPRILDSGELTTFEGGAVRSDFNVDGTRKGRCDLLPLSVVYDHLEIYDGGSGKILEYVGAFQKHSETDFLHEALRRFVVMHNEWRTVYDMLLDVSKHYEEGAEKYGEGNWRKGLPVKNYVSSMVRHYLKWLRGDTDEPHDRAFVWNALCCIWEVDYSPRAKTKEVSVAEEATTPEVNSGRFYICNRKPCEVCQSDCHLTRVLGNAAVLELNGRGVRYEDCPVGLFFHSVDGVFLKTEIINAETGLNTAVHIGLGLSRKFDADTMVTPIKYPFEERERE